ncbi:hypothetical protein ACFY2R_01155 [Micromonospora olivasterospora]|uniref:Integral membrane protein n=1 Tax=Micromonospora olivasterospora TaxID=1880 RepID=A0A562ICK2_MICOL|nr:hypothetical protein [Micromonospora olivasterospora]TWH68717.1 hypothetical protein JD77_03715 [Micromonospora olivasterospora]
MTTHPPRTAAGRRAGHPPRAAGRGGRDATVLAVEAALLGAAVAVGALLDRRGVDLHADAAPLYASWRPHVGWGTVPALLVAAAVVRYGPGLARRAPWPRLLAGGYLAALAWTLSLALVDGWSAGFAERLTVQAEYLHEVPGVRDVPAMLAGFTGRILDFQPDSWSTHTSGHPPGALLLFVALDRVGLGGGTAAALACVLAGATVSVSVPAALRALGREAAARAALPFLVLLPGAVWVGASADGIFAAVLAAGLALLARPGRRAALPAGLLLGLALHLSYGLVLAGVLALTVVALRPADRRDGWADRWRVLALAGAGVAAVTGAFVAAGFWWLDGYHLVVERYYQGWAADRPYGYWIWANLAALLLCAGPAAGPALARALGPAVRRSAGRDPAVWLPVAAAVAVLAADLSGLSKAEVERIWLPFAVWLLAAVARLPAAHHRWWLAGQAATALVVNHLLWTVS